MQPNFTIIEPPCQAAIVLEDITELSLEDLCRACGAHVTIIYELVSEGVIDLGAIEPNQSRAHWRFTGVHLHRAKVAMRLQRDLGVNFAGAALVLDLLEELDETRSKLKGFDR